MFKWFKLGTLAAVVAVVGLMALGVGTAAAQGPAGTGRLHLGLGLGPGGSGAAGIGSPQNSLVAVAAKTLGMEQAALVAELNKGKTIADVAKEKNVATSKIVDAVVALRTEALKAAVDAKRITQAQADAALAAMKTQITERISAKFTPQGPRGGMRVVGKSAQRPFGLGTGRGFVDANKDGICDNCRFNAHSTQTTPVQPFGGRGRWSR